MVFNPFPYLLVTCIKITTIIWCNDKCALLVQVEMYYSYFFTPINNMFLFNKENKN